FTRNRRFLVLLYGNRRFLVLLYGNRRFLVLLYGNRRFLVLIYGNRRCLVLLHGGPAIFGSYLPVTGGFWLLFAASGGSSRLRAERFRWSPTQRQMMRRHPTMRRTLPRKLE